MTRISTEQEFIDYVKNGCRSYAILDDNIILSDGAMDSRELIDTVEFSGVFDGNNHTIVNLSFNADEKTPYLFPKIGCHGVIKNLTIEGCIDNKLAVGGFTNVNSGLILNCVNKVRISGGTDIGGICCINTSFGKIAGCANFGAIQASNNVGGISAFNEGFIGSCKNYGKLTAGRVSYEDISANGFKYNQIAGVNKINGFFGENGFITDFAEHGQVIFTKNNSLLEMFLENEVIAVETYGNRFRDRVKEIILHCNGTMYYNNLEQHPLHVIASRAAFDQNLKDKDYDLIAEVITDLLEDVDATDLKHEDKTGNTLIGYLTTAANNVPEKYGVFSALITEIKDRINATWSSSDDDISLIGF